MPYLTCIIKIYTVILQKIKIQDFSEYLKNEYLEVYIEDKENWELTNYIKYKTNIRLILKIKESSQKNCIKQWNKKKKNEFFKIISVFKAIVSSEQSSHELLVYIIIIFNYLI